MPLLWVIIPLLSSADPNMEVWTSKILGGIFDNLGVYIFRAALSIPVAMYIFGLIYGAVNKNVAGSTNKKAVYAARERARRLPDAAVNTALIVVCAVYVMFIGLQISYLAAVIAGRQTPGFSYSEFARRGFFDLCAVSAFNLIVLYLANAYTRTEPDKNTGIKILNALLSLLTLCLIATALGKMFMYIGAYGLTLKRILTSLFMLWLAVVFVMIAVRQAKRIKLVLPACVVGGIIYMLICILPLEYIIASVNAALGY